MNFSNNFKAIKGDASFRLFYRKIKNKKTSIIVYAKKEKKKNLLVYDAINRVLVKNKIIAPRLLSHNLKKNFIEIEDFGDQTIYKLLKKKDGNQVKIFKKIINILVKIQSIKDKKTKNFNNKKFLIPKYHKKVLIDEALLFSDWYANKKLSKQNYLRFKNKYKKIIKNLTKKIKFQNNVFVHRDFHVSNLMFIKKKIAVIDSQDALIGNKAYDLASLIDDVRFKTSPELKDKIYKMFLSKQKKLNIKNFKNDFEIISVLRNLKIIGIFTRLAFRDKKKRYLKLIPYAWTLIKLRTNNNKYLKELNELLLKTFNKKIKPNEY